VYARYQKPKTKIGKKKVCADQQNVDTQKALENFFNITVERTFKVYAEVYAYTKSVCKVPKVYARYQVYTSAVT